MLTFLQFEPFNYLCIYITMTSSKINQNSYGMIINLTFYLNHVGLVVCLYVFQGCINPWHDFSHIIHYISFLNVENILLYLPYEDNISTCGLLHIPNTLWVVFLASFLRNLLFYVHLEMATLVYMLDIYSLWKVAWILSFFDPSHLSSCHLKHFEKLVFPYYALANTWPFLWLLLNSWVHQTKFYPCRRMAVH